MSNNTKISTKFEIERKETEYYLKMKLDEYKSETYISIDIKMLTLNSNKYPSSYYQPSDDLIKWLIIKSPEIFPCITIHQTYIIHDTRRRHYSSNSKMVGCHYFFPIKIFINKQDMDTIQITQSRSSQHI